MWILLWRPALGLLGLLASGAAGYLLATIEGASLGERVLMLGGWIMLGLLALGCLALLVSGFATAVLHIQDRGHGDPPSASA
jgi:hypothetical protein